MRRGQKLMAEKQPRQEFSKILFRKRKTLSADPKVCAGCRTCEVICSLSHELSVDLERSRIYLRSDPFKGSFIPMICHQCADVPCYEACLESAIEIETVSGVVSIHEEKCTGCRACEEACPFKAIRFNQDKNRVFKCDLCRGDPECVNWCPMNALGITEFGGTIPK
jgi:carbon-monoxide dehydrogenase iron sulfur subunit